VYERKAQMRKRLEEFICAHPYRQPSARYIQRPITFLEKRASSCASELTNSNDRQKEFRRERGSMFPLSLPYDKASPLNILMLGGACGRHRNQLRRDTSASCTAESEICVLLGRVQ
jgi:hypothetical protein